MNNLNNVLNLALESDKKTFEFSKMNAEATLKSIDKIHDVFDIINKHLSEINKELLSLKNTQIILTNELLNLKNRVDALEKTIT